MGASTAMITAGYDLPDNVIGVVADCGFTSAKDIIKKVIRDLKLPANILYPFVKLGALIYGGFKLESVSSIEALKKCKIPVIFFHGDADDFVPYDMSVRLHEACASAHKALITIPGAGHGLAFPVGRDTYVEELARFKQACGFDF